MLYPVKIEFKDYPSGSWQDWSEYLSEPPVISKKVESENEGEAGLIVFDDAEVSFRYESGSPVYNAFSIDLTSKQRYLFRISAPKSDKTYVQLFEGIADFSTLKWNEFNNIISFNIVDKLSALNLLQGELTRILDTLNARVLAQYPDADGIEFRILTSDTSIIWINAYRYTTDPDYEILYLTAPIIFPGEIIRDPWTMSLSLTANYNIKYAIVTESFIGGAGNGIRYIAPEGLEFHYDPTWGNYIPIRFGPGCLAEYGQKEIYGIDVLNYNAGVPQSINGFSLIDVVIKKAWSDVNIIYRDITSYNIPLNYFILFLDENPLGKTPLDALKMIADSMKCYIFFDRAGNLIVQSKAALATGGTARSIGNTKIVSGPEKKYFWDKLVDGVTINVKSWAVDELTGENLVGVGELTKQPVGFSALQKIKPKNSIKKDLLVGDPNIDTQEELDKYAATEALSMLNFYGLRHNSFDLTLNLDDNTINWELIDRLTLDSLTTFFTKLEFDLVERTATLESVEITGHDYDFRQLVFGAAESSGSSIISNSGSGGGSYYTGNPIFNLPLQMSGGIVSLGITDNLKLTADKLDAAQALKTTDTPTFNQMLLSAAATLSNHAVRADRTLQITTNAPLTGGGIAIDLTANRSWTLGINTANLLGTTNQVTVVNGSGVILGLNNVTLSLPQNIHTGATPTFYQMLLNTAATLSNHAVRADRTLQINTTAPLTGGGIAIDLTANRSWTLGINSANLLGTTNRITVTNGTGVVLGTNNVTLNLPQDIHTGASPTFAGETINGNILQSTNAYIKNNFNPGWTGSGWQLDYGVSYANQSTLQVDNLWVRGSMTVYELIVNQIRATNGSFFISSTAVVKDTNVGQAGDISIIFESDNNLCPFAVGDILLMQRFDIKNTLLRKIAGRVEQVSGNMIDFTYLDRYNNQEPIKGDVFVRVASSVAARQGSIYLSSDDINSPFIDIKDGVATYADWSDVTKIKVRLGKLAGITFNGNALSGYGLYSENVFLSGQIYSSQGGFGGSLSSPAVKVNSSGLQIYKDASNYINEYYTSTSDWGIKGVSAGSTLFQLGSTNNISGWAFDTTKLSNSNTRLEASASLKGLAVSGTILSNNVDLLKVGQFTFSTPTDYTSNLVFGYSQSGSWGSWSLTATSLTALFSTNFWSSSPAEMKSFAWTLDVSAYLNKFIRVRVPYTLKVSTSGYLPKITLTLTNGTVIKSYNTFDNSGDQTLDETFLCTSSTLVLNLSFVAETGFQTYDAYINTFSITNFYVIDSTPIAELTNGAFRIYDSGGRRYLKYDSTDGLKISGGLNIDGITLKSANGRLDAYVGTDNRLGLKGYTLPLLTGGGAPASSTTYYWANQASAPATSAYLRLYVPKSGRIRGIQINTYSISSPTISSGYWAMAIVINGGSPIEFASKSATSGTQFNVWENYDFLKYFGYGINVNEGDYIYIKETTPVFGTAPSTTYRNGIIYIE